MGRWAQFTLLLVAAIPAGLVCFELFEFITRYSGNARTLHQVIAYGTGVCALTMVVLPILPLVQKSASAAPKKEKETPAVAEESEVFGESGEVLAAEEVGSGELEELGSGEIDEVEEFEDASSGEISDEFADVMEEDEDGKK